MAQRKAVVIENGNQAQIDDADTLIVGAALDRATAGQLDIGTTNSTSIVIGTATVPVQFAGSVTFSPSAPLDVASGGTGRATLTANNVVVGDGTNQVKLIAPVASGDVLTWNGTAWVSAPPSGGGGGVTNVTASAPILSSGGAFPDISLTAGTNVNDVLAWDGSAWVPAPPSGGGVAQVTASSPIASSGGATPNISLTGTVGVANGGTGVSTTPTNGQLLVGNGSGYTLATITQGSGITVTNGAGTITISATGSGTVTSVDGSGGGTGLTLTGGPITTTGTLTLGGTLNAANGGTGQSIYAVGDLLYANTTTTLAKLADVSTGNALISGGIDTAPAWGKIGLTTHVSGTLPIANGGTGGTTQGTAQTALDVPSRAGSGATGTWGISVSGNAATATTSTNLAAGVAGAVPYQSGAGATGFSAAGSSGQVLTSAGPSAPTWTPQSSLAVGSATTATTSTNLAGGNAGVLPYQTAAGTTGFSALGSSGQVLLSGGTGSPTWANQSSLAAGTATTATNLAGGTAGAIHYQSAAGTSAFSAVGTSGQLFRSGGTGAPTWVSAGSLSVNFANSSGSTTDISGGALGSIPYQSASSTTSFLAAGTAGQLLQTNAAAAPTWVSPSSLTVGTAGTCTGNAATSDRTSQIFLNTGAATVNYITFAASPTGYAQILTDSVGTALTYDYTTGKIGAGAIGVNFVDASSSLSIGTASASSVIIGRPSITTTIVGSVTLDGGVPSQINIGTNNTLFGSSAGSSRGATLQNSVAVGASAQVGTASTGQNTVIGANAGSTIGSGTNLVCIGYDAEPTGAGTANEVTLGNASIARFRLGAVAASTPNPGFAVDLISTRPQVNIGHNAASASAAFVRFFVAGGNGTGAAITQAAAGGFGVLYTTGSDYRLKQDVETMDTTDALARVGALRPVKFRYTTQPNGPLVEGFIAHEAQAVVPQAVTHTKDALDEEGNPQYQGIDQSNLIPLLTAAMQKLKEQVEILKAEVAALRNT